MIDKHVPAQDCNVNMARPEYALPDQSQTLAKTTLIFALPILGLVSFDLIGQLYLNECILAVLGILALLTGKVKLTGSYRLLYPALLAWFIGQLASDLIRDIEFADTARGIARIVFFTLAVVALGSIITSARAALIWCLGAAVALGLRAATSEITEGDPLIIWKFGLGQSILTLSCLLLVRRSASPISHQSTLRVLALLHACFGVASFFANARSFAGISLMTAAFLIMAAKFHGTTLRWRSLSLSLLGALALAQGLATLYSLGAASGWLGREAEEKYYAQISTGSKDLLSVLLAGRSEGLVSFQAIADSPVVGHGSWAKNIEYTILLVELKRQFADDQNQQPMSDLSPLIPSHSHIFGAWVESGLLGGICWILIFGWGIFAVLPAAWNTRGVVSTLCIISLPQFLWNLLFSPFGANVRVDVAGLLTVFCLCVRQDFLRRVQ